MVLSHDRKLHALCDIKTDRGFWLFLLWLFVKDIKSLCVLQTGK